MEYAKLIDGQPVFPNRKNVEINGMTFMYLPDSILEEQGYKPVDFSEDNTQVTKWQYVLYTKWVEDENRIYRQKVIKNRKDMPIEEMEGHLNSSIEDYAKSLGWESSINCRLCANSTEVEWVQQAALVQSYYDRCWKYYINFVNSHQEAVDNELSENLWNKFLEDFPRYEQVE